MVNGLPQKEGAFVITHCVPVFLRPGRYPRVPKLVQGVRDCYRLLGLAGVVGYAHDSITCLSLVLQRGALTSEILPRFSQCLACDRCLSRYPQPVEFDACAKPMG